MVGAGPALDAEGRLLDVIGCRRCGYDLRGLALAAACPECGTSVGESARPDLLRYADPRWRRNLRRGALLMAVAVGLDFAWLIGMRALLHRTGDPSVFWVTLWGELPILAAWLAACWMLARRDPSAPRRLNAGSVALALAAAGFAGSLARPLLVHVGMYWLFGLVESGLVAIDVAVGALMAVVAARLARRLPDARLASRHVAAAAAMAALGTVAITVKTSMWWLVVFGARPDPGLWVAVTRAATVSAALWGGACAWWLYLLLRLRRQIRS